MWRLTTWAWPISCWLLTAGVPAASAEGPAAKVSYDKDVRPLLQAHCQGCHQPAKARGEYVMTDFQKLLAGGQSGQAAITPKDPGKSHLLTLITPRDGQAEMPQGKKPLADAEIDLIKQWVAQGAVDDTPATAVRKYDLAHPPVYTRPPVITALDFSPDGKLLAVAGFHEVLLVEADSGQLTARLVGLAERIQSLRFSPDGTQLAVAGGLPGRMGEVQVWNVAKKQLKLALAVAADTLYGVSWSPDGGKIAFGCTDNTVRAIDAGTGEQVLSMGSHTDWALDTVFSADGSHLVSVGRDMTTKLTEVATQRFVDNVTSITPGALKGGIQGVARHPQRDEIIVGGSDGAAKVYRMHRLTKRAIGDDANLIRQMPPMKGRIFGVAVSPDGKRFAAGSSLDGAGEVAVYSYEFDTGLPDAIKRINEKVVTQRTPKEKEALEKYHQEGVKQVAKTEIKQAGVYAVAFSPDGRVLAAAGTDGVIRYLDPSSGSVVKEFSPAPVMGDVGRISNPSSPAGRIGNPSYDFVRDVNPVLSRLGCNAGTCHGAAQGKNGFKLSLRGYDPIFDVRALADDHAARRVTIASPDDSLMLLKATAAVPHVGGQLIKPGEPYYEILRGWIAGGAKLDLTTPRVVKIEVTPLNPVVETIGGTQQMKVVATYADGKTRDVTKEAFLESGNMEVATTERGGKMTAVRRGEAPMLARYEGAYAATTLTVMGDRTGFVWKDPPVHNKIDELAAAKWQRMQIQPSELCGDVEFLRRVYLDLTGLPPTAEDVRQFLADARETKVKRDELVDRLMGGKEFVEYWTNKWADLLQVNRKFLGAEGAAVFRQWIRTEVEQNTPYDQLVRKVLTATGSNRDNPPASYYKILRDPTLTMENTTHLFLGVRFNCNKCHDHPFERWTQDQYYQTSAFFARVELKPDPQAKNQTIGQTAVEKGKPLYEIVADKGEGELEHQRTGAVAPPRFPYPAKFQASPEASRREQLAAWITTPDNPYFAKSYVNRLWGYLFGIGIIEPIDDIRAGNPPTNPELLDYLTEELVQSGFDARHVLRLIAKSRTYQLSVAVNKWNADDRINFSHAAARRLPAEVLLDTIYRVTGSASTFPGVPPGTRAAELPDSGVELPSGFLSQLGRPARESACECERTNTLQLGPVMALVNGQTLADAIGDPKNAITQLVAQEKDDAQLVNELFLRILNRPASEAEAKATLAAWARIEPDHEALAAALKKRAAEIAPIRAQQEEDRLTAIPPAKAALADYQKELEPKLKERERQRLENINKLAADLKQYEDGLAAKLPEFEKKQKAGVEWIVLDPKTIRSTGGAKLAKLPDLSVLASGTKDKDTYQFIADTDLKGITAIRLEVLADEKLPGGGPGRGAGGNFVLTEFQVEAATKDGTRIDKLELTNPLADFSQERQNIANVIDGLVDAPNGWGVAPATGVTHWATFQVKQPAGFDGGTTLTFALQQRFNRPNFTIGRFRIAVAVAKQPVGLSLSQELAEILKVSAEQRDPKQKEVLLKHVRATDKGYQDRKKAVADARQPLPIDPKLKELQETLAALEKPLPEDRLLVQLRQDVEVSTKQLANQRLTGAQDLAWALINNPAFLFNK